MDYKNIPAENIGAFFQTCKVLLVIKPNFNILNCGPKSDHYISELTGRWMKQ